MTKTSDIPAPALAPETVEAYLRDHPVFLSERPELVETVFPARALGEGVADFQAHALRAARREVEDMRAEARTLIATARANMSLQANVHKAVLAFLGAATLEDVLTVIGEDLPVLLQVDLALLCAEPELPAALERHVPLVRAGLIETLLGRAQARLRENLPEQAQGGADLYGEAAALVRSDALVRLEILPRLPPMLLVLASREAHAFQPGQGTELACFLASVLSACLKRWVAAQHDPGPAHGRF